jgi:hypothetical protein
MIRRGRKRLGATRDSLRSQAGVEKETLGGCRECHGETPRHERLFEVTEVGADVRFVQRDGLHRRLRFMSDVCGRAGAARTFSEVWPFADLILQTKVPLCARSHRSRVPSLESQNSHSIQSDPLAVERRGGRGGRRITYAFTPVDRCQRLGTKDCSSARRNLLSRSSLIHSSSLGTHAIKTRPCDS